MTAVAMVDLGVATPSTCTGGTPHPQGEDGIGVARNASSLLPRCLWTDEEEDEYSTVHFQNNESDEDSNSDGVQDEAVDDAPCDKVLRYMGRTSNAFNPCQTLVWPRPDIVNASRAPGAPAFRLFRLEWDVLNVSAIPTVFGLREVLMSPPFHTNCDLATMWIGLVVTSVDSEGRRRKEEDRGNAAPSTASTVPTSAFQMEIRVTSASECSARLGVRIGNQYCGAFVHCFRETPWTTAVAFGSAQRLVRDDSLRIVVEVYDVDSLGNAEPRPTTAMDAEASLAISSSYADMQQTHQIQQPHHHALPSVGSSLGEALAAVTAVADCPVGSATLSKAIGRALLAMATEVDLLTGERFLMLLCGVIAAGARGLPLSFFTGLELCAEHLRGKGHPGLMQLRLLMATPSTGFAGLLTPDQQAWVCQLLCHPSAQSLRF